MNKRLELLLDQITTWPDEAQEAAVQALADIEENVRVLRTLTPEDEAKLAALRDTINRSIERGGSYTDEEVEGSIAATLDAWERKRKDA